MREERRYAPRLRSSDRDRAAWRRLSRGEGLRVFRGLPRCHGAGATFPGETGTATARRAVLDLLFCRDRNPCAAYEHRDRRRAGSRPAHAARRVFQALLFAARGPRPLLELRRFGLALSVRCDLSDRANLRRRTMLLGYVITWFV